MTHWKQAIAHPLMPIRKVIQSIDANGMQIALIADENNQLLGTVTDGDVRRGILKGISLDAPVSQIMKKNCVVAKFDEDRKNILALMRQKQIRQIPIVDEDYKVVGMEILQELLKTDKRNNFVVLMAGGLGTRLRPLTEDCPKPLLKVGNRPILETILENFIQYGFRRFFLSVHYKDSMLKDYFEDGAQWGVTIEYLSESRKLGTAGALSLLPEKPKDPVIVMNGDLLTKINFQHLMDFHLEHKAAATMCIREYDFQVPYGVVKIERQRIKSVDEKPVQRFFVNAGIYVLNPETLPAIPKDEVIDMPRLFETLLSKKLTVAAFPIREYWLDVGRIDDFERANDEFPAVFQ